MKYKENIQMVHKHFQASWYTLVVDIVPSIPSSFFLAKVFFWVKISEGFSKNAFSSSIREKRSRQKVHEIKKIERKKYI